MPKGLRSIARSLENVPFVPVASALFGIVSGILMLATPAWLFERNVVASGLPSILAAAAPPLGNKAQIMAAIVAVICTSFTLWLVSLVLGRLAKVKLSAHRRARIESDSEHVEYAPHPDAPVRRPLFAESDLGAPFMSDEAIAHARDQLVYGAGAEDDPEPPEQSSGEGARDRAEPLEQPTLQAASETLTLATVIADPASIAGLLDRLERALERREQNTGSSVPILPGEMAALRKILGESTARH